MWFIHVHQEHSNLKSLTIDTINSTDEINPNQWNIYQHYEYAPSFINI